MSTKRLRLFSCAFCFRIGNGLTTGLGKTSACWQCEEGAYHCIVYPKKVAGLCLYWLDELRVMYLHGSNFAPYTVWSETQSHHIFHFGDLPKVVAARQMEESMLIFGAISTLWHDQYQEDQEDSIGWHSRTLKTAKKCKEHTALRDQFLMKVVVTNVYSICRSGNDPKRTEREQKHTSSCSCYP